MGTLIRTKGGTMLLQEHNITTTEEKSHRESFQYCIGHCYFRALRGNSMRLRRNCIRFAYRRTAAYPYTRSNFYSDTRFDGDIHADQHVHTNTNANGDQHARADQHSTPDRHTRTDFDAETCRANGYSYSRIADGYSDAFC